MPRNRRPVACPGLALRAPWGESGRASVCMKVECSGDPGPAPVGPLPREPGHQDLSVARFRLPDPGGGGLSPICLWDPRKAIPDPGWDHSGGSDPASRGLQAPDPAPNEATPLTGNPASTRSPGRLRGSPGGVAAALRVPGNECGPLGKPRGPRNVVDPARDQVMALPATRKGPFPRLQGQPDRRPERKTAQNGAGALLLRTRCDFVGTRSVPPPARHDRGAGCPPADRSSRAAS